MFKGIRYRLVGFRNSTLVIDHVDVHKNGIGVASVPHTSLGPAQQEGMARRILAAMNLTQHLSLVELETAAASPFPSHEELAGPLTDVQRRQARELLGSAARDEVLRAIAIMGYLNGLRDAPPRKGRQIAWVCRSQGDEKKAFTWGGWNDETPRPAPNCTCCHMPMAPVWISTDK